VLCETLRVWEFERLAPGGTKSRDEGGGRLLRGPFGGRSVVVVVVVVVMVW